MRVLFLLLLSNSLPLLADESWQLFRSGEAFDLNNNTPLYSENHFMRCNTPNTVRVTYSQHGEVFAQKSLVFYAHNFVPDIVYEDLRLHTNIRVQQQAQTVKLQTNDESALLPLKQNTVADAGFDRFIAARLTQLEQGEPQQLDFVSPTRLDTYAFEVQLRSSTAEQLDILLQPEAKWLQWLLDPVYVTYQRVPFRIRNYAGISNVEDVDGHYQHVRIHYSYYAVCGLSGS